MANSWWEIQVLCHPHLEESIFWRLNRFGCSGTATQQQGDSLTVRAYLPQFKAQLLDLAALALWLHQDAVLVGLPQPIFHWKLIEEEDWSSSWKQYWQPTAIGDRLIVYPAWLEPPMELDRLVLRLDPGVAFGTGTHPTTQLCLESLEIRLALDNSALILADIGCGSGILSIGAVLLGAQKVYAVDTDPLAVASAQENRHLNHIDSDTLVINQGSVAELKALIPEGLDGVVCNILADVIIELLPELTTLVKANGWAILSGILLEQTQAVANSLEQNGWQIAALWKRQNWCCFQIRRIPCP